MPYLICPAVDTTLTFQWGIKKTARIDTIIQTPASGRGELRIPLYAFPLWDFEWKLMYIPGDTNGVLGGCSTATYTTLQNFFIAVQGQGSPFLFLDPYDNTVTQTTGVIGTGDGATTQFQMVRQLTAGGADDLIQNFVNPPSVYVNGVLQTVTTDYSIDQYGTITFTGGHTPGAGHNITWAGQFYFLCRFANDSLPFEEIMFQVWQVSSFKFVSVLL